SGPLGTFFYAYDETGLFHNGHRDYNPATGRYIQPDPIGLEGGINRYGYVGGNPVMWSDPDGLQIVIPIPGGRRPSFVDPDFPPGVGPNHQSDSVLQELIERIANRREYKNRCDEEPPPGFNACERAKWEVKKWMDCKALREANTNRWWGGEDERHNAQLMSDIEINISRAERAVKRVCKENCP
ncbi:RHS repeat-associated core domain-containing protein, partial [Leptothrix ochracea]